ncbi:MAG: hypothetical protein M0Z71_05260 [Nitrospiraceae bacterium]|nr:hypothetical protein [Nitrospiraceae bacterium]
MNHGVILSGFLMFFACVVLHVFIWRVRLSMISSLILVAIFIFIPSAVLLSIIFVAGVFPGFRDVLPDPVVLVEVLVLHISLSLAYIANYPAVRAISPSLEVMLFVWSSPGGKMTQPEIEKKFSDTTLVNARVDDLMIYRLLIAREGRYELTGFGRLIILGFIGYRKMLGLPAGEG